MLRTTRQIRTEEDRFGGYSNRAVASEKSNRFEAGSEDAFPRTGEPYHTSIPVAERTTARRQETSSLYSQRRDYESYPDTAEFVGTPTRRTAGARAKRDADSVMPTVKTRVTLPEATEAKQSVKKQGMLTAKTKIMLGIYAAVVVVLAAIVIATGIAIGGMGASVEALQSEINYRNTVLTQQSAELAALDNDTMVVGQATELGMQKPASVTSIELLPMGETVSYEARTNWFDKFCDWLSKLIGG